MTVQRCVGRYAPRGRLLPALGLLLAGSILPPVAQAVDAEALVDRGRIALGDGDVVAAINWYRRAADLGYLPAILELARVLDYAELDSEAVDYYRLAAEKHGDSGALYRWSMMRLDGEGVPADFSAGLDGLIAAADLGDPSAMTTLGNIYEHGKFDVAADAGVALRWYEAAAEEGVVAAMERLESAYRMGELGLAVDVERADALKARIAGSGG